jgi:glucokinase
VATAQVVLGLDFGGTKTAAAVCTPAGERLAAETIPSYGDTGARASFGRGVLLARQLLAAAPEAALAAVGVSTFGIPYEDRVELAPAIDGWGELAFGAELRAAFPGALIRMATDAKAAAYAEWRWGALADCDPAVYLNLGTGLSVAIVAGGQVLRGAHGAAGEIGYNLRTADDVGAALGARPVLEDAISGGALLRRSARISDGQSVALGDVFAAGRGAPELDRLVTDFVTELAFHLVNLAICVDPVRIAVGGGMAGSWERLQPGLQQALSAGVPFPPELVVARFPTEAPLIGATALAADAAASAGNATRDGAVPFSATLSEGKLS